MTTPVLDFGDRLNKAYPGLIYDLQPSRIVSRNPEGGSIYAGAPVSRGTEDNKVIRGGAAAIGIAVRDLIEGQNTGFALDNIKYSTNDAMPVLTKGWIWVYSMSGSGGPGSAVKYNTLDGECGIGAPGVDEAAFIGATLENTVTGAQQYALLRLRGNTN